ncbi:MAG: dipeptidase [Alphaproteobacteria bacterium]|nr:dipeptidase [Alphaproteobacteria bacterium]HPF45775.1 dipeptidase [Emcibacteraceae bacterium]
MNKNKQFLTGTIIAIAFIVAGCSEQSGGNSAENKVLDQDQIVAGIHKRVMTLDTHVDINEDMTFDPKYDPGTRTGQQVDLVKMDEGGLDAAFFIVYMGQTKRTEEGYAEAKRIALRKFDAIHRMVDMYPDQIGFAYTPEQAREIYASGRKVAMIGIENGYAIGKDLSLIEDYYNRGARYMTLAHNGHNDICDSAQPQESLGDGPEEHGGVSEFGYKVIDEMNRVGMMVDISHVSVKCMMQATKYTKVPPIASHSGVYALAHHVRNMTDEQMIALADACGVMQVVAFSDYVKFYPEAAAVRATMLQEVAEKLGDDKFDFKKHMATPEFAEAYKKYLERFPPATVQEYVDHIDYAVNLIGIDHVGIASDFEGGGGVTGWNNASETMNVTRELVKRGYTEEQIAKIWSGNTLALWERVNEASAKLNIQN